MSPGSHGSPKAARHRLHRRDRHHASRGRSAAPGGNEGRAADGKPAAGGSENARAASASGRSAASAHGAKPGANGGARLHGHSAVDGGSGGRAVGGIPAGGEAENLRAASASGRSAHGANPGANRAAHGDGRSAVAGGNDGRGVDDKRAAGGSENARASSTSGRSAATAHGANPGANRSAHVHGSSAAAGGNDGRAVNSRPTAGGSENARSSSTSGRSAAAGDAANRIVKNDSGRQESSAADDVRQLQVSINHRSWLYLLGSICPAKGDEMLILFDEVETRHRRLVDECDGSEAAELLAGEVITYWLERMKCSMEEQFESQSKGECVPASVAARARATESATKRLLSALKSYDERKSEKT